MHNSKRGIKKQYIGRINFTVEMSEEELKWFKNFFHLLALSVNQSKNDKSRDNAGFDLSNLVGINLDSKKLFTFHQAWCSAASIDDRGISFNPNIWDSPANAKPLIQFLDFFFFDEGAIIRCINDMDFISPRKMSGHIKGEDEHGDMWEYIFEKSVAYDALNGQKTNESINRLTTNYFDQYVEKAKLHALVRKQQLSPLNKILKI